jgi:hypothetical protein
VPRSMTARVTVPSDTPSIAAACARETAGIPAVSFAGLPPFVVTNFAATTAR